MKSICLFFGVLAATVMLGACSKGETIDLTADNLTKCSECEFYYHANAQLDGLRLVDGSSRVFTYKEYWDPKRVSSNYTGLFIEIPSSKASFVIKGAAIGNGKVAHIIMCPNCGVIATKPVNGFIQGQKVADNKWLVDATVELVAVHSGEPAGSVSFKQYFTPAP